MRGQLAVQEKRVAGLRKDCAALTPRKAR
jgi:hypothetical protein